MNTLVTIKPFFNEWRLCIAINGHVSKTYHCRRLIEALDVACKLKLHIDNISELPLNQYLNGVKYVA